MRFSKFLAGLTAVAVVSAVDTTDYENDPELELLSGLASIAIVYAGEHFPYQYPVKCAVNCVSDAVQGLLDYYDEHQSTSSILSTLELICDKSDSNIDAVTNDFNLCLRNCTNSDNSEMLQTEDYVCQLFNNYKNKLTPYMTDTAGSPTPASASYARPTETSCVDGTYHCVDSGKSHEFTICANGKAITQTCGAGTVCKSLKNSIICDWA